MALRLVIGRAGSGRTTFCLREVADLCRRQPDGAPLIILTPEQAAYESERALAEATGGYVRARVVGFTRLVELVQADSPAPRLPRLTAAHREILCARLVAQRRRDPAPPPLFRIRGIEEALTRFVAEARQHGLSPHALRAGSARSPNPLLARKGEALAGFLDAYEASLRERFQDPHDTLADLAGAISRSDMLAGARVYLDGFYGFTPVEERVVAALMRRCPLVTATLCIDPALAREHLRSATTAPPQGIFATAAETLARLLALATETGTPLEELVELPAGGTAPHRFAASPLLAAIEAGFLERTAPPFPNNDGTLRLVEAPSIREEAREAARTCARWIADDGIPPGRIGVLARSLEPYAADLIAAFEEAGVPCFADRVEPLSSHPLVNGLEAASRVLLRGWASADVLDFARSGLSSASRRDVDRLQAFCDATPPPPGAWRSVAPWSLAAQRSYFEDEPPEPVRAPAVIDSIRRAVAAPLAAFEDAIAAADSADGLPFGALIDAAESLVDPWALSAQGDETAVAILARLAELFRQGREVLGPTLLARDEALAQISALLRHLSLPRIPPLLGQVALMQLDRSRFPPLDAVVLVGWNDGQIPGRTRNTTILSDAEREELVRDGGIGLAPSSRREFLRESFLGYIAVTRAAGRLVVVRSALDEGGERAEASPWWGDLRRLAPGVPVETSAPFDAPDAATRPRALAMSWLRRAARSHEAPPRAAAPTWTPPTRLVAAEEAARVLVAARDRNRASIDPAALHEAFGGHWRTSVSSIESLAACPYKHFVRAVLRPAEPMPPVADTRDTGNVAHAILKEYAEALIARGIGFGEIGEEDGESLFDEVAERVRARVVNIGVFASRVSQVLLDSVIRRTRHLVAAMREAHTVIRTRPVAIEARFGGRDPGTMPSLRLRVASTAGEWTVDVRGQIDRIDRTIEGSQLMVVDYKTGTSGVFALSGWTVGERMQLPTYLLVAQAAFADLQPGAAVNVTLTKAPDPDDPGATEKKLYTGLARRSFYEVSGALRDAWKDLRHLEGASKDPNEDPARGTAYRDDDFEAILRATRGRLVEMLGSFLSGGIEARPRHHSSNLPCTYCSYRGVCRFDRDVNLLTFGEKRDRAEILEQLRGGAHP